MVDLLKAALFYAAQGVPVFPLVPDSKMPMTKNGVLDATTDQSQIKAWWKATPDANIGGATGFVFDVLDIDEGGEESLLKFAPLGVTPESMTPSGGTHLFMSPSVLPLKNSVRFAPGLDFRTKGGYVVLPPSKNVNGGWKWKVRLGEPMVEVPMWIVQAVKKAPDAQGLQATVAPTVTEGGRNDTLFRHACLQRRFGLQEAEILGILEVLNRTRCRPVLDRCELEAIAKHAGKYRPEREPEGIPVEPDKLARSGSIGEFVTHGRPKGVPSGFAFIDGNTTTGGFPNGQMSVVSAYTGGGKSSFMLQAAYNMAKSGNRPCYVTFADLTGENIFDRLVKNLSGWYGGDEPSDQMLAEQWHAARSEVRSLSIHVHDVSDLRHGRDIEAFSEWLTTRKDEFDIVLCDYGQEIRSNGGRSDYEHAELVSAELRWLASRTLLPIVVGSQTTPGKEGALEITKGSRVWEERAGLLLRLKVLDDDARLKVPDPEYRGVKGLATAKIAKNRFGKSGLAEYWQWNDAYARFEEL